MYVIHCITVCMQSQAESKNLNLNLILKTVNYIHKRKACYSRSQGRACPGESGEGSWNQRCEKDGDRQSGQISEIRQL